MREAIGATWIMGIVIAFIALFSGYLAFSVNYSKAFKVKDGIVDRIQKHNGPNQAAIDDIADMMNEIGYSSTGKCSAFFNDNTLSFIGVTRNFVTPAPSENDTFNYCIQKVEAINPEGQLSAAYYSVYVFFSLSIPIVNEMSLFNVSGETVNIYFPDEGDNWFR